MQERKSLREHAFADVQAIEDEAVASKLLAGRAALDEAEARYRQLVAQYGGNRKARRRARAEVRKRGTAGQ